MLIAGTGRAGTTFLVQLLTRLGFDTGFTSPTTGYRADVRAGMETHPLPGMTDAEVGRLPYVVKDPQAGFWLPEIVGSTSFRLERLILPVRDLEAAAASRARSGLWWFPDRKRGLPKGPHSPDFMRREAKGHAVQRAALATVLGETVAAAISFGIPVEFLRFEELHDWCHLHDQLSDWWRLHGVSSDELRDAHKEVFHASGS